MSNQPGKSCTNCPSYLEPEETPRKFRKSIGAPMCGRFGYVLGKPGNKPAQADKLAKHYAQTCVAYGEPMPAEPLKRDHFVTLPDPDARDTSDILPVLLEQKQSFCRSCAQCRNFIPDNVVADELGWSAGLCAARGKLLMPSRLSYEAKDCEYRVFGQVRRTTQTLHLLPEYEDAFNLNVDPTKAYFKAKENFVDPVDYPTDKDVTEVDTKSGIRAWRLVKDPEGTGLEVYLPIYNLDFFSEDQQTLVPRTGQDEHAELYVDHNGAVYKCAVLWTQLDETPAMWGQAGTGKTELFRHLAWMMVLPFHRISITGMTELDDIIGKMKYTPEKGTYFQYGRLPKAWTTACVICIDEPNVGPNEVWQAIRPLTDNSKQLVIDQNNSENLPRHTDCYMGMAMNPAWSPINVGSSVIGDADARRLMHIYMELPPATLEREIISNRVALDGWELDKERLDAIMAIAVDVRALCDDGTLPITWGIAQQIKVARASRWFSMPTAYRMAIGDFLEPQANEMLLDQVRAHVES